MSEIIYLASFKWPKKCEACGLEIPGYNRKKESYKLTSTGGGWPGDDDWDRWECDCQWYTKKKEAGEPDIWCAHKGALAEALKRKAEGLYDLGPREGLKA